MVTKRYGNGKLIQFYDRYLILTDKIQSISNWKNGLLDGESREWWENGNLRYQYFSKEGIEEGDFKEWDKFNRTL